MIISLERQRAAVNGIISCYASASRRSPGEEKAGTGLGDGEWRAGIIIIIRNSSRKRPYTAANIDLCYVRIYRLYTAADNPTAIRLSYSRSVYPPGIGVHGNKIRVIDTRIIHISSRAHFNNQQVLIIIFIPRSTSDYITSISGLYYVCSSFPFSHTVAFLPYNSTFCIYFYHY